MDWTAIRVRVAAELTDAVANFLLEEGAAGIIDEGVETLEAHVPTAEAARVVAAVRLYLTSLTEVDPRAGRAQVLTAEVPAIDWEAHFRAHHRPTLIGGRLLIAPPWEVPSAEGREVLVIEPGMAFGTGQHATTRTCLEEIEALVQGGAVRAALDVGTGSGILAAALARLGVPRVVALDNDPLAAPLARDNLARNRAAQVAVLVGTAAALRGRFDLVVANLLADILVEEAPALCARVAPHGWLVLSGLLSTQRTRVASAYPDFRLEHARRAGEWETLRLVRES